MPFGGLLSAGIGAGGSLLGGIFGSKGASQAAQQQAAAQQKVINETGTAVQGAQSGVQGATTAGQAGVAAGTSAATGTLSQAQQQELGLLQPYLQSGTNNLQQLNQQVSQATAPGGSLNTPFSFTQQDLTNNPANPGYQFTLQQGQQAIQKAAAAQGNLFSSGTLKSLAGYTEGTANQYESTAYNQALQNFQTNQQQTLNRLGTIGNLATAGQGAAGTAVGAVGQTAGQAANLTQQGSQYGAGLGLQGATTSGNYGLQGAGIIGNALAAQGNAQAAGTVGSTNAWLNALQGGTNAATGYLSTNGYGGGNLGNLSSGSGVYGPTVGGVAQIPGVTG